VPNKSISGILYDIAGKPTVKKYYDIRENGRKKKIII
jgi:hypothetical protein